MKTSDLILKALRRLAADYQPRPGGGWCMDDILWAMGSPFLAEDEFHTAIEELEAAGHIRAVGEFNESTTWEATDP